MGNPIVKGQPPVRHCAFLQFAVENGAATEPKTLILPFSKTKAIKVLKTKLAMPNDFFYRLARTGATSTDKDGKDHFYQLVEFNPQERKAEDIKPETPDADTDAS